MGLIMGVIYIDKYSITVSTAILHAAQMNLAVLEFYPTNSNRVDLLEEKDSCLKVVLQIMP